MELLQSKRLSSSKLVLMVLASFAIAAQLACEGDVQPVDAGPDAPTVVDLEVSPLTLTIGLGETGQMISRLVLSDGTREDNTEDVRWSTSDSRVATIDDSGLAQGLSAGMVEVTAATGVLTASATIVVQGNGETPPQSLSYPSPLTLFAAAEVEPVFPTVTGGVASLFVIVPSLPTGLQLDAESGVISGTPASTTPAIDYVVTASNGGGSTETTVRIEVACDHDAPPDPALDLPDDNGADANGDGIDGVRCGPLFVTPNGDDAAEGTIDAPVATLQQAISLAASFSPPRAVYAAGGTYLETVTLASGVSLYGGYDAADGWRRDASNLVIIRSAGPTVVGTGIEEDVTLDVIQIESTDTEQSGGDSIAVDLSQSSASVTFSRGEVRAGRGGDGSNGANGVDAPPFAADGDSGDNGCENSGGFCMECGVPARGAGGFGLTVGTIGGAGGIPAIGEADGGGQRSGGAGDDGEDGAFGGPGGVDGLNGGRGGDGADGAAGIDGADGNGGAPSERGLDGQAGTFGGGGGGGGGGSGGLDGLCDSYGGAGGGGGGGADAGTAGKGGAAGGDSIAIRVVNTALVLRDIRLRTSRGGSGGDGGRGGNGGDGGSGGSGGIGFEDSGPGGTGGDGGRGGDGGHGGGGGGGSSLGILTNAPDSISQANVTFDLGEPGAGGQSPGETGTAGLQEEIAEGST